LIAEGTVAPDTPDAQCRASNAITAPTEAQKGSGLSVPMVLTSNVLPDKMKKRLQTQLQQLRQKVMMELRLKANDYNTFTKLYEITTKFRKNMHIH